MAQVRAGHGAVDPVADDRRSGVQQHALAVAPVPAVETGVQLRELARFDDAIGLAEQQIELVAVVATVDADHCPGTGSAAGDQRGRRRVKGHVGAMPLVPPGQPGGRWLR